MKGGGGVGVTDLGARPVDYRFDVVVAHNDTPLRVLRSQNEVSGGEEETQFRSQEGFRIVSDI